MNSVLITGATSGIGQQLAKDYADSEWEVLACGRNTAALTALKQYSGKIRTLSFDLTDREATLAALEQIEIMH